MMKNNLYLEKNKIENIKKLKTIAIYDVNDKIVNTNITRTNFGLIKK
jgi:hypothetical protein